MTCDVFYSSQQTIQKFFIHFNHVDCLPDRPWRTLPQCAGVPQGRTHSTDPASHHSPSQAGPGHVRLQLFLCLCTLPQLFGVADDTKVKVKNYH